MATSSCKRTKQDSASNFKKMFTFYPFTTIFFPFLSKTHLFLSSDITSSLQDLRKEDIEAFLNWQKDEAGDHGAQVVDDVIDPLVSKAQDVQERHDVALALREDLLQEGLLKEAPCEPGQSPVNQRLQTTDGDLYQACLQLRDTHSCFITSPSALEGKRSPTWCRGKLFLAASSEPRK